MTATNASMTAAQTFVPLSSSDAGTLASGYYQIDTEVVQVLDRKQKTIVFGSTGPVVTVVGRQCVRAAQGTSAATHTTTKTLSPALAIDEFKQLPTADPLVAGAAWVDAANSHVVKVSTGS